MFDFFLEDYFDNVFTPLTRKFTWFEKMLYCSYFVTAISAFIFMFTSSEVAVILSFFSIVIAVVTALYFSIVFKKEKEMRFQNYKCRLAKLNALLCKEEYNLRTDAGIAWLIASCQARLGGGVIKFPAIIKNFVSVYVFPLLMILLTPVVAVAIKDTWEMDSIYFSLVCTALVLLLIWVIHITVDFFADTYKAINKKYSVCEYLMYDLSYLQTQDHKSRVRRSKRIQTLVAGRRYRERL